MSYITITKQQHNKALRLLMNIASGGEYEADEEARQDLESILEVLGYDEVLVR